MRQNWTLLSGKRALVGLCVFLYTALFTGCYVPSLHPLTTQSDAVLVPELLGTWHGPDPFDDTVLVIKGGPEPPYDIELTVSNGEDRWSYEGRLVRLGGVLFLDVFPEESPQPLLIPHHMFFRVELHGGALALEPLDEEWVADALENGQVILGHEKPTFDLPVILTASTKALQQFVLEYAGNDQGVWGAPWKYQRQEED